MKYGWIILFVMVSSIAAWSQASSGVKELERQRKKALEEIEMTNQLLSKAQSSARSSLNRLNLLSQQLMTRRKVLNLLNEEIGAIDNQMKQIDREIGRMQKELGVKQQNYSKSVRGMYKKRNTQDRLLFIFSAESFSQSLRRMRYLREYADWQKRQASEIIEKRNEIAQKRLSLEKTKKDKQALLGIRESEARKLQQEEASQQKEVNELNKQQRSLQAELKRKQQRAAALDRQIEKLVAEEVARAESLARAERKPGTSSSGGTDAKPAENERRAETKGGYEMTREERKLSGDFVNNRGKLPFPVSGRYTIVGYFGEQQHQQLKYVRTNNSGIDLQVPSQTDARAVFTGEVTSVFVVPGYNNSVIVRHGNYLTVYANLVNVYVKKGDKVSVRQALGSIYSDPEDGTSILHFQLWKEKEKLNPLPWLNR